MIDDATKKISDLLQESSANAKKMNYLMYDLPEEDVKVLQALADSTASALGEVVRRVRGEAREQLAVNILHAACAQVEDPAWKEYEECCSREAALEASLNGALLDQLQTARVKKVQAEAYLKGVRAVLSLLHAYNRR